MRKYIEVAKIHLKTQLAWRVDVIFNMLFTISKVLFAYLLWGIIFKNKSTVAGFTFQGMMSYYILSSFLSQLEMSGRISDEVTNSIRNGTFSKYMILPMNIEKYFVAMEAGLVSFYLIFDLVAAVIWVFLFRIQFVFTNHFVTIICALFMIVFGMLFMVQLNYFLGLLTLKYEDIGTFLMIKNNVISLVTGSIIPLILFPSIVVNVMKILPFYYVTYLPAMLLTGRCQAEAICGVGIILGWCILMQIVTTVTWKKYRKKYDGVGI